MKIFCLAALALNLAFNVFPATQDAVPAAVYEQFFTGTNLAGWNSPEANPFWSATKGILKGQNDSSLKGNVLYTKKDYRNFDLETEVRWSGEIDSGIMFRKPELQLQFGVSRSLKTDMTGSFYTGKYPEPGRARKLTEAFKPGEWNKVRLVARGDTFTVWVNDIKTTEYTDPHFSAAAPIGLQVHPGLKMEVEFRNLKIKELE